MLSSIATIVHQPGNTIPHFGLISILIGYSSSAYRPFFRNLTQIAVSNSYFENTRS
jgi:hypothetical protein